MCDVVTKLIAIITIRLSRGVLPTHCVGSSPLDHLRENWFECLTPVSESILDAYRTVVQLFTLDQIRVDQFG